MGRDKSRRSRKRSRRHEETRCSSSSSSSREFENSKRRRRDCIRRGEDDDSDGKDRKRRAKREKKRRERISKRLEKKEEIRHNRRKWELVSEISDSDGGCEGEEICSSYDPESVLKSMLNDFNGIAGDLEQLLQMVDHGQVVDIKDLSDDSLVKHLKKLFLSLNLKEIGNKAFVLSSNAPPTLEVVGTILQMHTKSQGKHTDLKGSGSPTPKRRFIGPEMPSAELLAAAARLTEAEAELRHAEIDEDSDVFIGPPPPAVVAEAESANEAERFEEVTRIIASAGDGAYDVMGINHKMSFDTIKKRYWKLSLMVHPDKCSHPQAHEAFVILNKAFKDLQDPQKRKVVDDAITRKEDREKFEVELRAMREAAQWRRSQGIAMDGDDELLAAFETPVERSREEWMTTLPPEKQGVTMQTTRFSKITKEGRGDTSVWTDSPAEKAQKAKLNYLEAYNRTETLISKGEARKAIAEAELVEEYNKVKRRKSLVESQKDIACSKGKLEKAETAEWAGKHPWKPWDREKDLVSGRRNVNFDPGSMAHGLGSRFSSSSFERKFL